jgi:N-acetylglucosaminyldiphosphoundecaprenol N-acetyl-beta-D-mannosaminyltransferase
VSAAVPGTLLPRASLRDVLRGRAPLVGARCDATAPRGYVSPVEARLRLGLCYEDTAAEETRRLAALGRRGAAGVVARTALARLWPAVGARPAPRPFIVSAHVDNVAVDEALEALFAPPRGARATMVHFVHPHALNLAAFDDAFAALLARAHLRLPDGVGVRLAAAILDVRMKHNVNGTDLMPLLCGEAARRDVPLVFIGAAPGVTARAAERLQGRIPGMRVAFTEHGYLSPEESACTAARVRALGRAVVLVGMGSPVQERWAWQHLASAPEATVVTVGGVFDFASGRIPRAPVAVRELGLEWAFRLAQEPRRMAKRYLIGNQVFVALALKQRLFGAPRGAAPAGAEAAS